MYKALIVNPGDAISATLQMTIFGTNSSVINFNPVFIVPWLGNYTNNGTVVIEDNLLSVQFNLTVPIAQ
jgi:hypothetical protein